MAIVSRSSNNWIFSLKVLLTLTVVLSVAMILKICVPVIMEFIISVVPVLWTSLRSWLKPPYLYVVINGIIITIAASSKFQQKIDAPPEPVAPANIQADVRPDFAVSAGYDSAVLKNPVESRPEIEVLELAVNGKTSKISEVKTTIAASEEDDDFVSYRSTLTPNRRNSTAIQTGFSLLTEKPLASGFRKTVKGSPEAGKKLVGVAKLPKRHDTLESTWETITEGRPIPLARHLKKSDTLKIHGRHQNDGPQEPSLLKMKKADSFKEGNNHSSSLTPSPGSGTLIKEPSLSPDELTRRVEAFIKKFNEDMRLQSKESLNRYKEMINRGTP